MSGKSYTMKEMKGIVEYLTEHKAYKEIRGRKMWMDFANSQLTNRTWQSLKETFLKRILPDVHNPYYRLTSDQILSFRQGYDVQERAKNKLEIHTISEDSNSNAENQEGHEEPNTSKALNEEKTSGEDIINSKVTSRNRASVDTVIIDNCYESAEDIRKVLDSPVEKSNCNEENTKSPSKSLRDLITYSEPLTPMLQEVLHDFDSDEDSDPKMQIVENDTDTDNQERGKSSPRSILDKIEKIPWRIDRPVNKSPNKIVEKPLRSPKTNIQQVEKSLKNLPSSNDIIDLEEGESDKSIQPKIKSLRLRKKQANGNKYVILSETNKVLVHDNENNNIQNSEKNDSLISEGLSLNVEPSIIISEKNDSKSEITMKPPVEHTQNSTNSTTDTLLPNNQEALEKSVDKQDKTSTKDRNNCSRKRASSQDVSSKMNLEKDNKQKVSLGKLMSMSDTDIVGIKKSHIGNVIHPKTDANKINTTKNEEISNTKKPSEKEATKIDDGNASSKSDNKTADNVIQASQINPCLQSVSLFAEQHNKTNDIDSFSSDDEGDDSKTADDRNEKKSAEIVDKNNKESVNKVVILNSHSDSDSNPSSTKITPEKIVSIKAQRNKALANVFGFSSGAVTSKRNISKRKNSVHHYYRNNSSSDSSEWTSESDSEYVSPPRGRRNRKARKYLKPQSARIHSLEDEGGLFVMYGKKIYPLVKDGRSIKNYLTYIPESDPNEEDNYWKQKYVKQIHKVEELEKLIAQSKQERIQSKSPILPVKSPRKTESLDRELQTKSVAEVDSAKQLVPIAEKENNQPTSVNKTLKITFAKKNQEVHLEGHWSQLHPVLAEVVEIFHKDTDTKEAPLRQIDSKQSDTASEKSSLLLVNDDGMKPIDVHEKVNKLESEIFKEIEERAVEEEVETNVEPENNVTKRKRPVSRSRTPSTTTLTSNGNRLSPRDSTPKRLKPSKDAEEVEADEPVVKKTEPSKDNKVIVAPKRQPRTPKKYPELKAENVAVRDTRPRTRKSKEQIAKELQQPEEDGDDEVRYMFPPSRTANKTSATKVSKAKEQGKKQYSKDIPKIFVSPNLSLSDSTQGYLDSDVSPPKAFPRRKRRLSTVVYRNQRNKHQRLKTKPSLFKEKTLLSDNKSSLNVIEKTKDDVSLKSEVYRSDSYVLLMQHHKNQIKGLEKIDEDNVYDIANKNEFSASPNSEDNNEFLKINLSKITNDMGSSLVNTDFGNSSSVSLPLSPELSIVENLSVSKELVNSINNPPTLNEIQANKTTDNVINDQYLISQVDVSMPLMQQMCGFRASLHGTFSPDDRNDLENKSALSESTLNKMDEVQTLSESLDIRLKNLLLESAKKISDGNKKYNVNDTEIKKPRAVKRCSTPRKKKETKKTKPPKDPIIEEEYMETYSYGGRKSCPPSIDVITDKNLVNVTHTDTDKVESVAKKKSIDKKKKDIIKVKIVRPKDKRPNVEKTPKTVKSPSKEKSGKKRNTADRKSIPADSGIIDNESLLSAHLNDSIDLIHNHSETCLQVNECIGDSVEFIETTAHSIISINSNSAASIEDHKDTCSNDALNTISKYNGKEFEDTSETQYHSPVSSQTSMNSLITDDLSEENSPPPSSRRNWYLLSEEDTSTNLCPPTATGSFGFAANLKQLFPIMCAVPDLSTITEMSRDNDNSRKPTLEYSTCDSNTMNDLK